MACSFCMDSCEIDCTAACANSCDAACENSCDGSCTGDCDGGCKGGCGSACTDNCSGTCTNGCADTCYFDCMDNCTIDCTAQCASSCDAACENSCDNSCVVDCAIECTLDCTAGAFMTRPSNFTGFNNVSPGGNFNITAIDWNAFLTKMYEFAYHKAKKLEIKQNPMTYIAQGDEFKADYFNEVITNMNLLSEFMSNITYPNFKSAGDDIYDSYFTQLKNCLNSVT